MSYVMSTSSEKRRITRYALDRDVPPLKLRCLPNDALNNASRTQTTKTSFSISSAALPDESAANASASLWSLGDSEKYVSATPSPNASGKSLTHSFRKPRRQAGSRGEEFLLLGFRKRHLEALRSCVRMVGTEPRKRSQCTT